MDISIFKEGYVDILRESVVEFASVHPVVASTLILIGIITTSVIVAKFLLKLFTLPPQEGYRQT